ncbi:MAG TPA: EamA family transporter, partial [Gammaproteobacteria bacterium]|nr:EamA family transporter [Gammaproteobacteria bacterium]
MTAQQKVLGNLAFCCGVTIWATMFPATEYLLNNWDPVAITFVRMSGGGLVLLVVFALLEDVSATLRAAPWGKIFLLGIVGVALSTFLFAWGIQLSSAVAGALIAATGPIVAALITGLVYGQALQKGIVFGVLLAVAGGICAIFATGGGAVDFKGGEIVVLLAMAIWVWYSYNCQRWLKGLPQVSIAALTVAAGSIGFAAYVGIAELSGLDDVRFGTELKEWLVIGWLSIGPAS